MDIAPDLELDIHAILIYNKYIVTQKRSSWENSFSAN